MFTRAFLVAWSARQEDPIVREDLGADFWKTIQRGFFRPEELRFMWIGWVWKYWQSNIWNNQYIYIYQIWRTHVVCQLRFGGDSCELDGSYVGFHPYFRWGDPLVVILMLLKSYAMPINHGWHGLTTLLSPKWTNSSGWDGYTVSRIPFHNKSIYIPIYMYTYV
jgi:hypothetical protein